MSQSVSIYMTGFNHALPKMEMMGTRTRLVRSRQRHDSPHECVWEAAGAAAASDHRVRVGGRGGGQGGGDEDEEITIMIIT